MYSFTRLLLCILFLATLEACRRSEQPESAASASTSLTVSSSPILSIGQEGRSEYEFSNIVGLGRFSGGDWVVADGASRELRYYDREGNFRRRVGGRGAGPEEFLDVTYAVVSDADKLYVFDGRLRRISVWSDEGELLRTSIIETPTAGGTVPRVVGFSEDGVAIWSSYNRPPCVVDQLLTDTVVYYSLDLSSSDRNIRPLRRAPGNMRWGNTINVLSACLANPIPFSRATLAFAGGSHLYLAFNEDRSLIAVNVATGAEVRREVSIVRRPLEPSVIEEYIAQETGSGVGMDENGAPLTLGMPEYARRLRETPYPDSLPTFDHGIVDADGWIWLRPYQLTADSVATWSVLAADSEQSYTVLLPGAFRPLQIGRDYIAGVGVNELGVETVRVFGLSRH